MSIQDTMKVVGTLIQQYRERLYSGTIAVDVRSGKPIWVRPIITDNQQGGHRDNLPRAMEELAEALSEFETGELSGVIAVSIQLGRPVKVSRSVELAKVRVG